MNEMRKLMEAVKHLDEDITAGFRNVTVSMDAEDVRIGDKPTTVAWIYAYDSSDNGMWRQKGFGWDSEMSESDYATLVSEVASDVNWHVEQAVNEIDEWAFNANKPRFNYVTFSSDITPDKELNEKFINDVISRSSLSKMESIDAKTYYNGEPIKLFKIDRPKKTLGQKIKDFVY